MSNIKNEQYKSLKLNSHLKIRLPVRSFEVRYDQTVPSNQ